MSGRDVIVIAGLALAVLGLMRQTRSKRKSEIYVSGLVIYPVKSCQGISVASSTFDRMGLAWDRRFLIVGAESKNFITQRQYPKMALIETRFEDCQHVVYEQLIPDKPTFLVLSAPNMSELCIPLEKMCEDGNSEGEWFADGLVDARVWDDVICGQYVGHAADRWLSTFIGCEVRMVATRPGLKHHRRINRTYDLTPPGSRIEPAFPDGFPILVANEDSLVELNRRMDKPIAMVNFRPNIILGGPIGSFAEDFWSRISIEDQNGVPAILEVVKHCSRCILPNVDPTTGERRKDGEPLVTLRTFRKVGDGVFFGVNCIQQTEGVVSVRAPVEVLVRHSMDLKERVETIRRHARTSHQPFED